MILIIPTQTNTTNLVRTHARTQKNKTYIYIYIYTDIEVRYFGPTKYIPKAKSSTAKKKKKKKKKKTWSGKKYKYNSSQMRFWHNYIRKVKTKQLILAARKKTLMRPLTRLNWGQPLGYNTQERKKIPPFLFQYSLWGKRRWEWVWEEICEGSQAGGG